MREYRVCTRCILDTTDTAIEFDEEGVCNHCRGYEKAILAYGIPAAERQQALYRLVEEIKNQGRGKEYDCVVGVSGGVDSAYTVYLVKQLGLRPLTIHMDNGWNSELAVSNIERVLKKLKVDLKTVVLDWEEFKRLQVAFLRASVIDPEVPTDHAIRAVLVREAARLNLSYVVMGTNLATEQIMPKSWTYGWDDWRFIKALGQKFGQTRLEHYPHLSYADIIYHFIVRRIKEVSILDYVDYRKQDALELLKREFNWRPYGGKHYESIFTRFSQGYIIWKKFNIDKRRAHLSTLIMSGQMTRAEALEEIKKPPYAGYELEEDMAYVIKKLDMSESEFEKILNTPLQPHAVYPNSESFRLFVKKLHIPEIGRSIKLLPKRI